MSAWKDKASQVIAEMSMAAYLAANTRPNGGRYRKHRQYRIPDDARMLVECLARDDEEAAKAYFIRRAYG